MMTRTLLTRCAPAAIAASAALFAIPATAQDAATAEPVIVLPDPAPASAPAPSIVLPDPVPVAPVSTVEAAPVEETSPAAVAPRPRAAVRATSQRPSAVAQPRTVAAAPAMDAVAARVAEPVAPATTVTPVETSEVAAPAAARENSSDEIAFAGLLGVLGLGTVGGVAYAASRRRRRSPVDAREDAAAYEQPVMRPVPAMSTTAPMHEPAVAAPILATPAMTKARPTSDPVALPAEIPASFEERDALLKELVAAEPDRANPFTSVRARARRAKLIMQSLGQDFRDRKPRINLSEYTDRWPALRGWQPATA